MKSNFLKYGLIAFFALFCSIPALADDDGQEPADPGAPVDNWVWILVIAGIALGAYFIMNQRRKSVA